MQNNKPDVVVIVGPTAIGKTKVSIDLAKKLDSEIISADSMQIYKFMNIGTAKPSQSEMEGIKHYLLDEIDPGIEFSVAQYKELAQQYLEKIISNNKTPIIVGGTGLYIDSIIYNIKYSEISGDSEYRQELFNIANQKGNKYLHSMLYEVDPECAQKLHHNDLKRIIRALEVYKCTNKTMTYFKSISKVENSKYNFKMVGLTMERSLLYERINKRVDIMIEQGLLDEVKTLLNNGYTKDLTSMQAIGYKELIDYLNGECTFEEAINIIKRETRRYAKRQLTWFRKNENIKWLDVTNEIYKNLLKNIYEYIAQ